MVSELETDEALAGNPPGDWEKLARLARESLSATRLLWGSVEKDSRGFTIAYRLVDCGEGARVLSDEVARCAKDREISEAVQAFVDSFAQGPKEEEDKTPAVFVAVGENLVLNGDFEAGPANAGPDHWQRIDNLTTFAKNEGKSGRGLVIDSDVLLSQWKDWRSALDAGTNLADAPAKVPTKEPKYDTVAGTYGVPYLSDYISVEPGKTYELSFDMKGRWIDGTTVFVAKVFVKGYGDVAGEQREIYRTYKACRTKTQGREYEFFRRTFTPALEVRSLRVQIYAYWPPDVYHFDNISIREARKQ
ncbi:MAG: hypothetical protein V2A58_01130 [Planctomycetota bacterium]